MSDQNFTSAEQLDELLERDVREGAVDPGEHLLVPGVQGRHNEVGVHEVLLDVGPPEEGTVSYDRHRLVRLCLQ